jgi:shikimate 5-dehydrogenase
MLVNQGAEAFKIWTEEEAPVKDMEEVINNLILKE